MKFDSMVSPVVETKVQNKKIFNRCRATFAVLAVFFILLLLASIVLLYLKLIKVEKGVQDIKRDFRTCHGLPEVECNEVKSKLEQLSKDAEAEKENFNRLIEGPNLLRDEILKQPDDDEIFFTKNLLTQFVSHSNRKKRKADKGIRNGVLKWTLPIKYKFNGDHDSQQRNIIRKAIKIWESRTCIRFEEVDSSYRQTTHLYFTKYYTCGSYVGRISSLIYQQVDLASHCLRKLGIVIHEIGHALGYWHEHQRSDRDDYIRIRQENAYMTSSYLTQLKTKTDTDNLMNYDYSSVLHYSSKAYSTNNGPTIETKDPLYQQTIGQRAELSFLDAKLANKLYCIGKCQGIRLEKACKNSGYQDPNNCDRCICPDGYGGKFCEDFVYGSCGRKISFKMKAMEVISSPNYDLGKTYSDFSQCTWFVQAPIGYKLLVQFVGSFNIYNDDTTTCLHWVEIRYKTNLADLGPRFCGDRTPSLTIQSTGREMLILFRSGFDADSNFRRVGFKMEIFSEPVLLPPTNGPSEPNKPTQPQLPDLTIDTINFNCNYMDAIIILDSSSSVGKSNWYKLLNFIASFASRLPLGTGSRLAIITYGNKAQIYYNFNMEQNINNILRTVSSLPFKDEMTNTSGALRQARELFKSFYSRNRAIILFTDGESNVDAFLLRTEADLLRKENIIVTVVGIGPFVSEEEMKIISTIEDFIIRVPGFDYLKLEIESYFNKICKLNENTQPCHKAAEIIFLVDSSSTVSQEDWQKVKDFLKRYIKDRKKQRISVVVYSDRANIQINYQSSNNWIELETKIDNLRRLQGSVTDLSKALEETKYNLLNSQSSVPRALVILTDGGHSGNDNIAYSLAQGIQTTKTKIIVIGLSGWVNERQMTGIYNPSKKDHFLKLNGYKYLDGNYRDVEQLICRAIGSSASSSASSTAAPPENLPRNGNSAKVSCSKVDVTFLLDSSGSVGPSNWHIVTNFTWFVINSLPYPAVNYGVISFGNRASSYNFLTKAPRKAIEIKEFLKNLGWKNQFTNTSGALYKMRTEIFKRDRPDVANIGVLITDGPSNKDVEKTIPEARLSHKENIDIITIGVKSNINQTEIDAITYPDKTYAFHVKSYDYLDKIVESVAEKICESARRKKNVINVKPSAKPTVPSGTQFVWSKWSNCSKNCGGCGIKMRYRKCKLASGTYYNCGNIQTESCGSRYCSDDDRCPYYAGRLYMRKCLECCPGYKRVGDICVK